MIAADKLQSIQERELRAYRRRRKTVSLISLGLLLGLFGLIAFAAQPLLACVAQPEQFREWIESLGPWGYAAAVGIMCLQVVVAFIPGEVVEIGAGYAFGAAGGMLVCLVGAALASAVVFGFTRLFGYRMVEAFVTREKIQSLKFIKNSKRLNLLIFILFFIPGTPKDVFTYFIGLTPMKLSTFLFISTVARIPSVITSTLGGHALGLQNYTFALLVFAVTAVLSLAGLLIYRRMSRQPGQK